MSFSQQLSRAIVDVKDYTDEVWRRALIRAFTQVVQLTPVDTGRAINNWFASTSGNKGETRSNANASGQDSITDISKDIPAIGSSYLLYNNLPYIQRLEEGWSAKSQAMVARAVAAWPSIVERSK